MTPQLPNLTNVPDIPLYLSIIIVFFLLAGSIFTFIGAIGLTFFRNFYDRLHMPTLVSSISTIFFLLASSIYISYVDGNIALRGILIIFFIAITAPISLMMLARAAAMRDFTQNWSDISHNAFWQLVTDETDAEVEKRTKEADREEAQQIAAEIEQQQKDAIKRAEINKSKKRSKSKAESNNKSKTKDQ